MKLQSLALAALVTAASPVVARQRGYPPVAMWLPSVYKRCVNCHHPNDIAPMSLLTTRNQALGRRHSRSRAQPQDAAMEGRSAYGKWSNDWSLSDSESPSSRHGSTGAKEGDPQRCRAARFSMAGKSASRTLIIAIPPHQLTADGPDEYEYFTVPTNFTEDQWVVAAELRPGNRKIVHHAHVFVEAPERPSRTRAKKDPPTAGGLRRLAARARRQLNVDAL